MKKFIKKILIKNKKFSFTKLLSFVAVGVVLSFIIAFSRASTNDFCLAEVNMPAAEYARERYLNHNFNKRTIEMIKVAERLYSGQTDAHPFKVTQGSYTTEDPTSAGTHDGGGAIDLDIIGSNGSRVDINKTVRAFRQAGFALWHRATNEGNWPEHFHGIAIGDAEASSKAKDQIANYFQGDNGLANDANDKHLSSVGRPIPDWAKTGSRTRVCPGTYSVPSGSPSQPTLSISSTGPRSINLTWTASRDDKGVTDYSIYRGGVYWDSVTGTSRAGTGYTEGKTYHFRVWAHDADGHATPSNEVSITIPDATPPSAPINLKTNGEPTSSSISITWDASTDNSGTVAGYYVFRSNNRVGTVSGTSFTDNGLDPNTTYRYTVKAFDAAGNVSAPSSELAVKTTCQVQAGVVCVEPPDIN